MFINNSRISRWDSCRRQFFWENDFGGTGLSPSGTEPEYLSLGKAVHAGLALYYSKDEKYSNEHIGNRTVDTYYYEAGLDPNTSTDEEHEQAEYSSKLVRAYLDRESPEDDFTVERVEDEFKAVLGEICWKCGHPYTDIDPSSMYITDMVCLQCGATIFILVGRLDLVVLRDGHLIQIDHKTAKSLSEDYMFGFSKSFQQLGYSYGYGKAHGIEIKEYGINFLQKAKTVGEEKSQMRCCPDCKNGKRKVLSCMTCNYTGKVERLVKLDPFRRQYFPVNDGDVDRYLISVIRKVRDIEAERELFKKEPDVAYPMCDRGCTYNGRSCPFVTLCWDGDKPQQWFEVENQSLEGFSPREPDYVDQLIKEEKV